AGAVPPPLGGGPGAAVIAAVASGGAFFFPAGLRPGAPLLAPPQGPITAPADNQKFGWIERAIGQCEAEAARSTETLYFVVIPVVATGDRQAWASKSNGSIGRSILLLGAEDTVEGVRAGLPWVGTRGVHLLVF